MFLKVGFFDPPKPLNKEILTARSRRERPGLTVLVATKTAGSILHKARGKMTFSCK